MFCSMQLRDGKKSKPVIKGEEEGQLCVRHACLVEGKRARLYVHVKESKTLFAILSEDKPFTSVDLRFFIEADHPEFSADGGNVDLVASIEKMDDLMGTQPMFEEDDEEMEQQLEQQEDDEEVDVEEDDEDEDDEAEIGEEEEEDDEEEESDEEDEEESAQEKAVREAQQHAALKAAEAKKKREEFQRQQELAKKKKAEQDKILAQKKEQEKKKEEELKKKAESEKNADFIAAKKFTGAKKGMVFKKGKQGMGYYKDTPPVVSKKRKGEPAGGQQKRQMTLQGGLKVEIVKLGREGAQTIKKGQRAQVRYDGRLASNGKRFDKGVIPFRVGAGEVIRGWDVGVDGMKLGEKRKLMIPPALAYGRRGAPPDIPGNAALVFDVELLRIN